MIRLAIVEADLSSERIELKAERERAAHLSIEAVRVRAQLEQIGLLRRQIVDLNNSLDEERDLRISAERDAAIVQERCTVQQQLVSQLELLLENKQHGNIRIDGRLRAAEYRLTQRRELSGYAALRCKVLMRSHLRPPRTPKPRTMIIVPPGLN